MIPMGMKNKHESKKRRNLNYAHIIPNIPRWLEGKGLALTPCTSVLGTRAIKMNEMVKVVPALQKQIL